MSLQDIKDTFYTTLRDRIAALNPARTLVLRGTPRPAVLVQENELPSAAPIADAFTLNWTALEVDPVGLAKLICEIHYATAGTTGAAGMDRGRGLAAMGTELGITLSAAPQSTLQISFKEIAGGGASTQASHPGNLFWTRPAFGPVQQQETCLQRTATVEVFGYE